MGYTVIAGDVKELMIDNISYPVPEEAECSILANIGTSPIKENEITVCTADTSVLRGKRVSAGFEKLKVILREDLESHLTNIRDQGLSVPVLLTVANGDTYSGELMVEGGFSISTVDRGIELSMKGNYFSKM